MKIAANIQIKPNTVVQTKTLFHHNVMNLVKENVVQPDGRAAVRLIVQRPEVSAIIAMTDDNKMVLVGQYRDAVKQPLWELPAGLSEKGETPLLAARRELLEETGFTASRWKSFGAFFTTAGISNEKVNLFLATGLKAGTARPDAGEHLNVQLISLGRLKKLLTWGEIPDAKTALGISLLFMRDWCQ